MPFVPPKRAITAETSIGPKFRVLYVEPSSPLNREQFRFLYMKPPLGERVRAVLSEQGVKPIELAKVAGVSKGLVSQWLSGQRLSMGYEAAHKINRKYGYSANWLMKGDGPKMAGGKVEEHSAERPPFQIESPEITRLILAFGWLTKAQKKDRLAELEADALTNKTFAKELGVDFEFKTDREILDHLIKGGDFPPGQKKTSKKGSRPKRPGFAEEDPE